jgi:hypothetical protein
MKKIFLLTIFIYVSINLNQVSYAQKENNLGDIVMVEGVYLRNLGNFGSVWSDAAGAYLNYGIFFPEHNLLLMRTGFISHNLRNSDSTDGTLSVIPLHIGGRYYFTNDRFMPFFHFMNGFNIVFENVNLIGEQEDRVLFKYFWQVGIGGTFIVTENINIDLGLNYNSAFYENDKELYGAQGAMMTGFEYSVGLAWRLNN